MLILLENFDVFLTEGFGEHPSLEELLRIWSLQGFRRSCEKLLGPPLPPLALASIGEEAINWGPPVKVRKRLSEISGCRQELQSHSGV